MSLHNRPLAFNAQTLYDFGGTFAAGEGRSQGFCPLYCWGGSGLPDSEVAI
jgi:hypothetical protein